VDANSELFKETYDVALDKNTYEIRFCELISASLTIPAAFFWRNVSLCWYHWLFMKIVYHYIFLLAINYLIFIHVLLIFNDAMILFHGSFWCLTHEKKTPEGAASRPGFRGFREFKGARLRRRLWPAGAGRL
ncbi:hypothetical protein, partial [uncultured Dialister sp.]|uniref:hypothetical protein n=1 Tax=uncultured Dialister sp. TaxID=278064 RepID=UPI0025EA875B